MQVFDGLHDNPFAVLTLIAAPAVLTNASSVLALGTSNRFARAVDRQRQLSKLLDAESSFTDSDEGELWLRQLHRAETRAQLLLRGLTSFYVSLGSFAAGSLTSVVGAILGPRFPAAAVAAGIFAIVIGLLGVSSLVFGSILLVRETRITLVSLREEATFSHRRFAKRNPLAAAKAARGPDPQPVPPPINPEEDGLIE